MERHNIQIVHSKDHHYCVACNTLCGDKMCICYTCSRCYHIGCVLTPTSSIECPMTPTIIEKHRKYFYKENTQHKLKITSYCPYIDVICSYCLVLCSEGTAECECGHFFHTDCIAKKNCKKNWDYRCPFSPTLWQRIKNLIF